MGAKSVHRCVLCVCVCVLSLSPSISSCRCSNGRHWPQEQRERELKLRTTHGQTTQHTHCNKQTYQHTAHPLSCHCSCPSSVTLFPLSAAPVAPTVPLSSALLSSAPLCSALLLSVVSVASLLSVASA